MNTMIETAAGLTLTWWTYPLIAIASVCSMLISHAVVGAWEDRQEQKSQADRGPYPCLAHLGTDDQGTEFWCWHQEGHSGPHEELMIIDPWAEEH